MCVKQWFIRTNTINANFVRVLRLKRGKRNIMERDFWNSVVWMSFTFASKLQQLCKIRILTLNNNFHIRFLHQYFVCKSSTFSSKTANEDPLKLSKQLNFFLLLCLSTVSTMLEIIEHLFFFSTFNMEKNVF